MEWFINSLIINKFYNTNNTEPKDLKPIVDYIMGYGLATIAIICGVVIIYLLFILINTWLKMNKAIDDGDIEGRLLLLKKLYEF
ncbi:hypothetical protein SCORR_v1c05380 [Spiroplasma corruscae]|uniref:Uncharacterized protein n=1 Tax=Spiroplasma corruscae TaxID=216934 RepID=A0A222EP91_9MOLU|nr:hypothetical protein [Spiroplasma corruscae]ASP28310.1 hypothetical protein SCORR_v1c05380 [Spiroplasma corruscae]